jgi:DMSO/TMAO reductase YedYZ molybdopterin-dependent catalytic subunit
LSESSYRIGILKDQADSWAWDLGDRFKLWHGRSIVKSKEEKVVQARMKLRERFLRKMAQSPSVADAKPLGSGSLNRHGMPLLPPEQIQTKKWPVLDLGIHPTVELSEWKLTLKGYCSTSLTLTWEDFMALEQVEDTSDFHCVTTWSRLDIPFKGVRFSELAALAGADEKARFILCKSYDGYTTNLSMEEALKDDVLLVHTAFGKPLEKEHGGPVRMITPQLWAWKGAKWINQIEFLKEDQPGYWEVRGYSNTAYPWRNDRYSE